MLRSTLLLTLSGIIAKTIDFIFRAYYSQKLGSEGMGLFSLTASIHSIMLTIATGGLGVAVSKIVSEEYSKHNIGGVKKTMRISILSVAVLSTLVIMTAFFFSKEIAVSFLKEERCEKSILFLSPSILFMGVSYCIKGYFYASRRIFPPASSEFLEQAVKIISIRTLLEKWLPLGIEHGCEAVFLGISIGEFSSCAYLSLIYLSESRRTPFKESSQRCLAPLFKVACPAMLGSLLSSFLRSKENVWIVEGLEKSGLSHAASLSEYGIIHGMIMPLIVFPLTLLSSCFTLVVPEISRASKRESPLRLRTLVSRMYRFAAFFGFLILAIYFTFADNLLEIVYKKDEGGLILRTIALLCPIMFMDSLSSGMLNGLGKQSFLLFCGISDSIARLTLICFLTPLLGKDAIIVMIALSNVLTFTLTSRKVTSSARIISEMPKNLTRPCLCAFLSFFIVGGFVKSSPLSVGSFITGAVSLALVFASCCYVSGAVSREDASWLFSRLVS